MNGKDNIILYVKKGIIRMSDIINNKCTGCSIAKGEIGSIIYETMNFVINQDPEVPLKGFLVISSKKHVNSLLNLNKEEREELNRLLFEARKALDDLKICKEVSIVQEERSQHFHIWLYPYYDWMNEKFGKGIKYLRDINEYVIKNATEKDKKEVFETIEQLKKYFEKQ